VSIIIGNIIFIQMPKPQTDLFSFSFFCQQQNLNENAKEFLADNFCSSPQRMTMINIILVMLTHMCVRIAYKK
jgi:hypothetical protein